MSEDIVEQAKEVKLLRTNVMKDVEELKERFSEIMSDKQAAHKRQQKLFHKMAKGQQQEQPQQQQQQ